MRRSSPTASQFLPAYFVELIPTDLWRRLQCIDAVQAADYPIQNGCMLSRAKIAKFKHNDMKDLEQVLKREIELHRNQK